MKPSRAMSAQAKQIEALVDQVAEQGRKLDAVLRALSELAACIGQGQADEEATDGNKDA